MEILIRDIARHDMEQVIDLLQQMSDFIPKKAEYEDIWNEFINQNNSFAAVAERNDEIIGYGTVLIQTNIRGGKMGHIEDVVTHFSFRKMGVGKAIMEYLNTIANRKGCYKTALQCKEHNITFYESCNYAVSGTAMQQFLR